MERYIYIGENIFTSRSGQDVRSLRRGMLVFKTREYPSAKGIMFSVTPIPVLDDPEFIVPPVDLLKIVPFN